jgi:hypothetical protein
MGLAIYPYSARESKKFQVFLKDLAHLAQAVRQ